MAATVKDYGGTVDHSAAGLAAIVPAVKNRSGFACLCALVLLAAGCRDGTPAPAGSADVGPVATLGDGGTVALVTDAQLGAYARYQRAMVDVYDALFRDLERLGSQRTDGGASGIPPQVRVVEAQALAEERARQEAGLTEAELTALEPLVLDVLNARALVKSLDAHSQLSELEAMRDQLEGDARAGIEQTIEDLKAEQAEAEKLTEVRARHGDANVERVLAHERALSENHELWLSRIAAGRK